MDTPSNRMRYYAQQIDTWSCKARAVVAAARVDGWTPEKVRLLDETTSCVVSSRTGFMQAWGSLQEAREGRPGDPVLQGQEVE